VQKKTKIPNDSIPFLERPGESFYEKESRDAEQVLTKERAARKALAKRKRNPQKSDSWQGLNRSKFLKNS
jgi:hypothetical protein